MSDFLKILYTCTYNVNLLLLIFLILLNQIDLGHFFKALVDYYFFIYAKMLYIQIYA